MYKKGVWDFLKGNQVMRRRECSEDIVAIYVQRRNMMSLC